jgi:hypothetical protein
VVFDGVLGEELQVWLRPREGRVVAAVALDPPDANPAGVRGGRTVGTRV